MDSKELIFAAEITLRRAILERFPPGPVREQWLAWAAGLAKSSMPHAVPVPESERKTQ